MPRSTMGEQHRELQQLMRAHQITPDWLNENGRLLIAPGITVSDQVNLAEVLDYIVLDPVSGRYICTAAVSRRKLLEVREHIEALELEEATNLLDSLRKNLEDLSQALVAAREKAQKEAKT